MSVSSTSRVMFIVSILVLIASSCNQSDISPTLYTVTKTDYLNQINVSGYLEADKSVTVACPRIRADVTILYIIPEGTYVQKDDTVCILDAPTIQTRYDNAKKNLEIAEIEYNKSYENLNLQYLLLEAQVKTIEATTQISQLDSLQKAYVSDAQRKIIELELKKSRIEKEKIQNKLKFLKRINESELRKKKLRIRQSQNNLDRAQDQLNLLILTSPVEGLVQYAYNWQTRKKISEGDIVWNNRQIVTIPDMSRMKAHIVVSESYYKLISPDQKVEMTIDAFPEMSMSGKVDKKSPVGREIERGNPVKVYDIYSSIDSLSDELQPGLSLTCQILIEELKDTVSIPHTSIFENDSTSFVYLKKNRDFEKQPIEIGSQSSTHAIISKGLEENDVISLINPYQ